MRIMFLTYADLSVSGAESTHVGEIYKSLKKKGHQVSLICRKTTKNLNHAHPFPFVNLPFLSLLTKTLESFTMNRLVRKLSSDSDVIYKRHDMRGFFTDSGYESGLPLVLEVNGAAELEKMFIESSEKIIRKTRETDVKSVKKADAVVVVSGGLKKYYIKNGVAEDKIHVVQNGFNPELFRPMDKSHCRKKLGLENRPTVLFVGDIKPWHGIEYAVKAVRQVKEEIGDVNLVVVGGKKDSLVGLSKMSKNLGIQDNIRLFGRVPYEQIPIFINSADLCLAPFIKQRNLEVGFSAIKLFEYAGCGKPIITTRLPCIQEIFDHMKNIYMVSPEDVDGLSEATTKMLSNSSLAEKLSKNILKMSKEYTWDKTADRIIPILNSVVE